MERKKAVALLRCSYEAHGYIRVKMEHRQKGQRTGWEVRLFVDDLSTAGRIIDALRAIELEPGTAFRKRSGWIVPVYGIKQSRQFLRRVRPRVKSTVPKLPSNVDVRRRRAASSSTDPGRA